MSGRASIDPVVESWHRRVGSLPVNALEHKDDCNRGYQRPDHHQPATTISLPKPPLSRCEIVRMANNAGT